MPSPTPPALPASLSLTPIPSASFLAAPDPLANPIGASAVAAAAASESSLPTHLLNLAFDKLAAFPASSSGWKRLADQPGAKGGGARVESYSTADGWAGRRSEHASEELTWEQVVVRALSSLIPRLRSSADQPVLVDPLGSRLRRPLRDRDPLRPVLHRLCPARPDLDLPRALRRARPARLPVARLPRGPFQAALHPALPAQETDVRRRPHPDGRPREEGGLERDGPRRRPGRRRRAGGEAARPGKVHGRRAPARRRRRPDRVVVRSPFLLLSSPSAPSPGQGQKTDRPTTRCSRAPAPRMITLSHAGGAVPFALAKKHVPAEVAKDVGGLIDLLRDDARGAGTRPNGGDGGLKGGP